MQQLVLASRNAGKLRELQALLQPYDFNITTVSDYSNVDVEETGGTFVENAILKARFAAEQSGLTTIADDSGLVIDALNGAPGIYSARYAGQPTDDVKNYQKVLEALNDVPEEKRTARFVCVLAVMQHGNDPLPKIYQGTWEGRITFEPAGNNGFGYNPIFYVPTHHCTAAEMSEATKNEISHRAIAFKEFVCSL